MVRRGLGIDDKPSVNATPVDEELHRFRGVHGPRSGLTPKTRSMALHIAAENYVQFYANLPFQKPSKNPRKPRPIDAQLHIVRYCA